jgi:alpha-tubulin suppressor-like RCC1 family protein
MADRSSPIQIGTKTSGNGIQSIVTTGSGSVGILDQVGRLYTFGNNSSGELGINTNTTEWEATEIFVNQRIKKIKPGYNNFVAIDTLNNLYTWGDNTYGQLGELANFNRSNPNVVSLNLPTQEPWKQISLGSSFAVAIKSNDSSLWAWGLNSSGQLGDGTTVDKSSPVQIGTNSWSIVSAGNEFVLAIDIAGNLYAWGRNSFGALGDGTNFTKSSPVQIGTSSWSFVSTGERHSMGIDIIGRLFSWGDNSSGQLGDGTVAGKNSPVLVPTTTYQSYKFISAGNLHTLAIRNSDSKLIAWGTNGSNRLGLSLSSTSLDQSTPTAAPSILSFKIVSAGSIHSLGIDSNDLLFTWGAATAGVLGDNSTSGSRSSPIQIGSNTWYTGSAGNSYTTAIRTDGSLYVWGRNDLGQLGDGTTINKSSPVQIGSSSWTKVSTNQFHTTAIDINGGLWAWGQNSDGQLGDFSLENKSSPVQVSSSINTYTSWKTISTQTGHFLAIKASDSSLWAWGRNNAGQLGIGTQVNVSIPTKVGNSSWSAVSAGASYSSGITTNGSLFTWGVNNNGQLGDNTVVSKSSPVQIGSLSWTIISSGLRRTMGTTTDGSLYAWGLNTSGQLGDGTTVDKFFPSKVAVSPVSIGSIPDKCFGSQYWIKGTDGYLYGSGLNERGQLIDGSLNNKSTFDKGTISNVSKFVKGILSNLNPTVLAEFYTIIKNDGSLWTWGYNELGQLGDGTTINRFSPVQLGTSSWSFVSSGINNTLAIDINGRLFAWGQNLTPDPNVGQLGDGTTIA